MTPTPPIASVVLGRAVPAQISVMTNPLARNQLAADLDNHAGAVYCATYIAQPAWCTAFLQPSPTRCVTLFLDHRAALKWQRTTAPMPHVIIRAFPKARIFHDKLYVLPTTHTLWCGSHNLTRYAWSSGHNCSIRAQYRPADSPLELLITYLHTRTSLVD